MPLTLSVVRARTWLRSSAALMGTTAELVIDGESHHVAAAFERLRSLEAAWSRFDPHSELNTVHARPGEWTPVSSDLMRALVWCSRLSAETDGAFDVTIRSSLELLGYDRTFVEVGDSADPAPPTRPSPGPAAIELDRGAGAVRIAPGASIDLGGIGKGLAADIVAAEAIAAGARSAYVCLGGDIHVCGEPPDDEGWMVPLLDPRTNRCLATHSLVGGGLVMSTIRTRRWRRAGVELHHIIDPRRGQPAETDLIAVAVAAASSARAEALAKAAIVLGSVDGARLLRRSAVHAWLVLDDSVVEIGEPSCSP